MYAFLLFFDTLKKKNNYKRGKMASKVIKCLSCGSSLNVNKNVEQCKCSYCGSVNVLKNKEKEVITDVNKLLKKSSKVWGKRQWWQGDAVVWRVFAIRASKLSCVVCKGINIFNRQSRR